jgi:cytoskeletal protein RodZ
MTIKASGRSALILAAGLWIGFGIGFARPSVAATGDTGANAAATPDNSTRHGSHHKKEAHRKSDKPADKSASDSKAATPATADGGDTAPAVQSSQMPATIANANAQLAPTESPADSAKAMSERVTNILQGIPDEAADAPAAGATPVVAANQLNDVDRALHEATPVALASADTPAPSPAVVAANSSDNSTWDHTSLIGKIFIGFGTLLTMASAARMFMA